MELPLLLQRGSLEHVYAARVGFDGTPFDSSAVPISVMPTYDLRIGVAALGSTYLAHWGGDFGALIGADLGVTLVDLVARKPALASDGDGYLIASHVADEPLVAQALAPDLTPYPPIVLTGAPIHTQVAASPGRYLVTWSQAGSIDAAILGSSGAVEASFPAIPTGEHEAVPFGACHGERCLIVWSTAGRWYGGDLLVARATTSGEVLDPAGVLFSTGGRIARGLVHDGNSYLLLWSEPTDAYFSLTIRLARLDQEGQLISDPIDVVTGGIDAFDATVATDGAGRAIIAYSRIATDLGERSPRVRVRVLDAPLPAGPDAGPADGGPLDGGVPDAEPTGPHAGDPPADPDACACHLGRRPAPAGGVLIAALVFAAKRRKRA